jgi:hypothetical protein
MHLILNADLPVAQRYLAERTDLPADVQSLLVRHGDAAVRETISERPDLDPEEVARLVADDSPTVGYAAARSGLHRLSADTAAEILASAPLATRIAIALDHTIRTREILERLARDQDSLVRLSLARRSDLTSCDDSSENVMDLLAHDSDVDVRCAVAERGDLTKETRLRLASDSDATVRIVLASSTQLLADLIPVLADDPDATVRRVIAERSHLRPSTIASLHADTDTGVRERIARHTETPPDLLALLTEDVEESVRIAAISNPHTPTDAIDRASTVARGAVFEAIGSRRERDSLRALRDLGLRRVAVEMTSRPDLGDQVLDWLFGEYVIGTPPERLSLRGLDIRHISEISLAIARNRNLLSTLPQSHQLALLDWHDGAWISVDGERERKGDQWALEAALAANASVLEEAVIARLVRSSSYHARSALVRNAPNRFEETIAELKFDEHAAVREAFERRLRKSTAPTEPPQTGLERDGAPGASMELAKSASPGELAPDDVADLIHSRFEQVVAAAAANRALLASLSAEQQMHLARVDALAVAKALAKNADVLDEAAVGTLAGSRFYVARRILAGHGPDVLPADAIARLSKDSDEQVRGIVGGACPVRKPADSSHPEAIIKRQNKEELLALIADDATLTALNADQQIAIANHRSVDVPRALANKSPLLHPETHAALARSPIFTARRELVRTAGTIMAPSLLDELANDDDEVVQRIAQSIRDNK